MKFDHPCQDWLEVQVGSHRKRLCGAYRSTLRSYAFNLTFHSNENQGHQGIWLHFSGSVSNNYYLKSACYDVSMED